MSQMDTIDIKELKTVNNLCRVCLTESKNVTTLYSKLDRNLDNNTKLVYEALGSVTGTEITCDRRYPSLICAMCMGLLNIAYSFKVQFKHSQKLLLEYFGESSGESHEVEVEGPIKQVLENESIDIIPVEIISKQGRYDLKDLIIVEDDNDNKPSFEGFLKNLGKEVSATFVNKDNSEKSEGKKTDSDNLISVIKIVREYDAFAKDSSLVLKQVAHIFENDEVERDRNCENYEGNVIELGGSDIENFFLENNIYDNFEDTLKRNVNLMSKRVQCIHCNKVYSNKKNLKRHISEMHTSSVYNYLCQLCGHAAKTKSGLYNHNISKHNDKRYECKICGKRYLYTSNLLQHTAAVHQNERNFLCTICGKNFNYANALEYHMRLHTGEKKYNCPYCDRKFTMQCGLKRHVRTHTGVRPFKCSYCDKAFRSKGEVSCHEMLHTGYRPYHCKYCGKGFTKTHNMKVHIMGHPGPHLCEICSRTFIDIPCLKAHLKTVHGLIDGSMDPTET